MGFYDSVKESVRQENTDGSEGEPDDTQEPEDETMPFDQLKKRAEDGEENQEDEPEQGDDTDIEVLASGERVEPQKGADGAQPSPADADTPPDQAPENEERAGAGQSRASASPARNTSTTPGGGAREDAHDTAGKAVQGGRSGPAADDGGDVDDAELVQVLRNIEEQNADILTVLRGIKRSLESGDHGS